MLSEDKAEDITAMDLQGKTTIADSMVVASGTSQRHVVSMAQHILKMLKAHGRKGKTEGMPQGDWVLIDAQDVIVHIFRPEVRSFYDIEKMWETPDKIPSRKDA